MILLTLQLLFLFLLLITGPWFANNVILLAAELAAIALGAWAIGIMVARSKFSGLPEPRKRAKLIEVGPYRLIRNPMYSAVLLGFGALLINYHSPVRIGLYLAELTVLLIKIPAEEKFLEKVFPGYAAYKSRTKRLIPFLY